MHASNSRSLNSRSGVSTQVRPFVSWAGSKRRLLPQILPHVPRQFNRYIEPFVGAGSLFLELAPHVALLNDACIPLVQTWRTIGQNPVGVYKEAIRRPLEKTAYYAARAERGGSDFEQAGRFIYLNKGAFNGLYRVNLNGEFNVPWGAPRSGYICDQENLLGIGRLISRPGVQITSGDFSDSLSCAASGDVVFVDPPYVTSHNNNGFIEYNEKIFSWEDQVRLSVAVREAVDRGAIVLVTNAYHEQIIALYPRFKQVIMERASTLAAAKEKRGRTSELLLIGRPV